MSEDVHGAETSALSEDQLRAVTIGELKPLSRPIVLVEYDPNWPRLFQGEAERIRAALGNRALRIEHVGSTSVPGLAIKPVIDVLLVVADSADVQTYLAALDEAGYVLRIREPEWYEHRLFKRPDTNINLHVFSQGCSEIDRMLAFRDWLRSNDADRELYARAKRALAEREWKYVQYYADAKTEVVEEILERAMGATPEPLGQRPISTREQSLNDPEEQAAQRRSLHHPNLNRPTDRQIASAPASAGVALILAHSHRLHTLAADGEKDRRM